MKYKKYIHFRTYERIGRLKKLNHPICYNLKYAYYWFYRLWNYRISNIPSDIKYFFQRGKRGYSDNDIWNLDIYLAKIISESCKKLAHETHGYPMTLSIEKWKNILFEISNGFKRYVDDKDSDDLDKKEMTKEEMDELFTLLRKYFMHLWD